jgi:5-methylthioadenosine/S-adenosylhomocysteine deaminase
VTTGDAAAVPAAAALTMATLGGARALGLGGVTGSLVPGKAADFITVDLSSVEARPLYDVIGHLVYAAGREHVTEVWVGGAPLMRGRVLRTIDEGAVRADLDAWRARVASVRGSDGKPMHEL